MNLFTPATVKALLRGIVPPFMQGLYNQRGKFIFWRFSVRIAQL
jgi:hypothetical protein